MKREKILLVEWDDTAGHGRWRDRDEAKKETTVPAFTVGFLIDRNEDRIVVASSCAHSDHSHVTDTMAIPMHAVKRISTLKGPKR